MHPTEARKCKGDLGCGQYNSGREVLRATNTWWQNEQRKIQINKIKVSEKMFRGEKYMSGAKDVLIKSVTQAIPTYVMGVFKLPKNTWGTFFKKNVGALPIIKWRRIKNTP
jgi:hypothetical protein